MIELEKKSERVEKMMEFSGMLNDQIKNMTIQELKKAKATEKYTTNPNKREKLLNVLEKIKDADKDIIDEFDETLLDGIE